MIWTLFERAVWAFFSLSIVFWLTYNWYDDFYSELHQNPTPYRLLQIWVQADNPSQATTPIGGSQQDAQYWAQGVESFLAQAAAHPSCQVTLDLVLDTPTLLHHQQLINHWENNYPYNFKLLKLDDLLPSLPDNHFIASQCTCGIAASCSDILRIFLLPQKGTYSTYMDIDTFLYRIEHQKKPFANFDVVATTSPQAYGLTQGVHDVFMGMVNGLEKPTPIIYLNNDCLISQPEALMWPLIHARLLAEIERSSSYWLLLNERGQITEYESYCHNLEKRLDWALDNPYANLNPNSLVINMAGPGFWRQLFDQYLIAGYPLPHLPSSGAWMGPGQSIQGIVCYHLIQQLFDQHEAQAIAKVAFLAIDFTYYKKRQSPLQDSIKKQIAQLWDTIPEHKKELALKLFCAPIKTAQEIAHEAS